ncbi:hypothetical protein NC652_038781 [Populus alba x Populus x berolinensis]|nr:hypothetical protein NC652_038781 [Populus alba x Populus x berolinensis]
MVLKTWIADAKEVIYEVEDLLIETDSEAQQIVLVVGSQTSMYQFVLVETWVVPDWDRSFHEHQKRNVYIAITILKKFNKGVFVLNVSTGV